MPLIRVGRGRWLATPVLHRERGSHHRFEAPKPDRDRRARCGITGRIFVHHNEVLCLLRASRHHETPSRLELLQKCRRDPLGRGRHQDLVKGRVLGPATGPVPDADADVRA